MEVIPFKNIQDIILINGKADNINGIFAFDTGAMQTTLNKKYFSNVEGKSATVAIFDNSLSQTEASEINIHEFIVGNITKHDLSCMLIDMSYVEEALKQVDQNARFYGSIGMDFFEQSSILLDYERSQITIEPHVDISMAEKIPLYFDLLPIISIKIAGEEYKFVLDSGANACLLSSELVDKISTVSLAKDSPDYAIPKIAVGEHEYYNINAVFTDISSIRSKIDVDGVIGGQILSKQLSLIDIKGKALYLF